jgi:hypothetical protein
MKNDMTTARLTSLVSAVLLLFTGAATAVQADDRVVGGMLMAAGLIVLGVWIALEVMAFVERDRTSSP